MEKLSLENELKSNEYPGRGIVTGRTPDGRVAPVSTNTRQLLNQGITNTGLFSLKSRLYTSSIIMTSFPIALYFP